MHSKLVIVADLGFVKVYKLGKTSRGTPCLDLLEQIVLEEAHQRLVESVTELSGRRSAPTQRNLAVPLDDPNNLQMETQRRLIKQISSHIEQFAQTHPESSLCFAVPKEINHLVVEALARKVQERIQVNLSRDLVKADKEQLLQHFGAAA